MAINSPERDNPELIRGSESPTVPFYSRASIQLHSSPGLTDPSATPLECLTDENLDSMQRIRIRNAIKKYEGDQSLLPLSDEAHDGVSGLTVA